MSFFVEKFSIVFFSKLIEEAVDNQTGYGTFVPGLVYPWAPSSQTGYIVPGLVWDNLCEKSSF